MSFRASALGLAMTLGLVACTPSSDEAEGLPPNRLVRLSEDDAKSLDPQKISDVASVRITTDAFEGLTRFDAAGEPEPALAMSWTISPDGLQWTFRLRPGLRFSDGQPITGDAFVQCLARLRDTATAAPTRTLFDGIATITASAPDIVDVRLRQPDPALPYLMAQPAMAALPIHRIARLGDGWTQERPLVTSGAYRVREWKLNDRILLESNPYWHDGHPPVPFVEWQPVSDKLTALRRFETGQADTTADFPPARLDGLIRRHGKAVHVTPTLGTYYLVFNTRHAPFDDSRIRRALSMTVDRPWITGKLLRAGMIPAWGLIPAGMGITPYRPEWANWPLAQRQREARSLLHQAGFDQKRPLRIILRFNSDRDHRRIATALAAMWAPLHVELSLFNSEASLHFAAMRRGDFELARAGWLADMPTPENFLMVHRSDAEALNYSGYASDAFDSALDRALATGDPARRAQLMRAAESILIHDAPIVPIYHQASRALVAPRVTGWQDNPTNVHPSHSLRLLPRARSN